MESSWVFRIQERCRPSIQNIYFRQSPASFHNYFQLYPIALSLLSCPFFSMLLELPQSLGQWCCCDLFTSTFSVQFIVQLFSDRLNIYTYILIPFSNHFTFRICRRQVMLTNFMLVTYCWYMWLLPILNNIYTFKLGWVGVL